MIKKSIKHASGDVGLIFTAYNLKSEYIISEKALEDINNIVIYTVENYKPTDSMTQ